MGIEGMLYLGRFVTLVGLRVFFFGTHTHTHTHTHYA